MENRFVDLWLQITDRFISYRDVIDQYGGYPPVTAKWNDGPYVALGDTTLAQRYKFSENQPLSIRWTSGDLLSLHLHKQYFLSKISYPDGLSLLNIRHPSHYYLTVFDWIETGRFDSLEGVTTKIDYSEKYGDDIPFVVIADKIKKDACLHLSDRVCRTRTIMSKNTYGAIITESYAVEVDNAIVIKTFYDSLSGNSIEVVIRAESDY